MQFNANKKAGKESIEPLRYFELKAYTKELSGRQTHLSFSAFPPHLFSVCVRVSEVNGLLAAFCKLLQKQVNLVYPVSMVTKESIQKSEIQPKTVSTTVSLSALTYRWGRFLHILPFPTFSLRSSENNFPSEGFVQLVLRLKSPHHSLFLLLLPMFSVQ